MKIKITKIVIAIVCLGAIYFFNVKKNTSMNNLVFKNIEALASGEEDKPNYYCVGSGDIECYGEYVAVKSDYLR